MEENKQIQNKQVQSSNLEEEYTCSLCLELLFKPYSSKKCGHSFCELCIFDLFDSTENLTCPLDRSRQKQVDFQLNQQLDDKIKSLFPEMYQQRLQFYDQQQKIRRQLKDITMVFGNEYETIESNDGNKHRWTIYVKIKNQDSSKYIKEVKFRLHPTFNPPEVLVREAPFELSRLGWGTFEIDIDITFKNIIYKNQNKYQLSHNLSFKQGGKHQTKVIRINESLLD